MANGLDTPDFGNFSIQSTVEGMGNQQLLNDLLSPETSVTNPDEIQKIDESKDVQETSNKKEESPTKKETPKDSSKDLQNFLFSNEEEEEEDDEAPLEKTTSKVSKIQKTLETAEEDDDDDDDDSSDNQFSALAKDLYKLGVFTLDDEDEDESSLNISNPEEFLEKFNAEKKKGAIQIVNDFIGQFGEDYQNAFNAIFVKGVHPKDYFGTYSNIENYADLDLSVESNQEAVIKQALADQGFDEEDIETEIERLKNYGDLETVATKHHKVLVKKEAVKLQQLEQEKERQLQQQAMVKNQYVNNVNTILQDKLKEKEFDGIPLNPKMAQELQDFLVTDKYKTPTGEYLTEFDRTILELKRPENHEMKVKVGLLLKILEKDPTLSTIQKVGVTKKTNTLFSEVARQTKKSVTKGNDSNKPSSWFVNN
jgi:hypothetical protein